MLLLGVAFLALIPADARPVALLANRHLAARTSATATSRPPQQRAAAPVGGQLLRRFQRPATPYGRGHRGVDLAADPGEPVRAALAGTVAFAGPVAGVPWVTVAHDDGLDTTYGGLEPAVRAGDRVRVGGVLGHATAAGRIDWGARHRARYVDPLGLLGGWVVRLVPVDAAS
jgi:murein DD-endopeptidase MepM/ murein hydrolase activator NlpD